VKLFAETHGTSHGVATLTFKAYRNDRRGGLSDRRT